MGKTENPEVGFVDFGKIYDDNEGTESLEWEDVTRVVKTDDPKKFIKDKLGYSVNFDPSKKLGKGGFGIVYRGRRLRDEMAVAVKVMQPRLSKGGTVTRKIKVQDVKMEIEIPTRVQSDNLKGSDNIIRLFDHVRINSNMYLFMELADVGTLDTLLKKHFRKMQGQKGLTGLDESLAGDYFFQIANGLHCLHQIGIAHRDIKPQNVLLQASSNTITGHKVKLSDFGLSKLARHSSGEPKKLNSFAGTEPFMAPEIYKIRSVPKPDRVPYDPFAADIWSLGVTLYNMICFKNLPFHFHNHKKHLKSMENGELSFPPEFKISEEVGNLLRSILEPIPAKRITFRGIFQHPWKSYVTAKQASKPVGVETGRQTRERKKRRRFKWNPLCCL